MLRKTLKEFLKSLDTKATGKIDVLFVFDNIALYNHTKHTLLNSKSVNVEKLLVSHYEKYNGNGYTNYIIYVYEKI